MYILLAVLGTGLLLSCTRDKPAVRTEPVEILFAPVIEPNTKLDYSENKNYPQDVAFALWAFDSDGQPVLEKEEMQLRSDGLWEVPGSFVWDKLDEPLVFFAASPCDIVTYDSTKGIVALSVGDCSDLLHARASANFQKGSTRLVVPLSFSHALASLRFVVNSALPESARIQLRQLTLEGLSRKGDFCSLPQPLWHPSAEKETFCFSDKVFELSWEALELEPAQYLVPQKCRCKAALLCDMAYNGLQLKNQLLEAEFTLSLNAGKTSTYRITISPNLELIIEKDGI